MMLMRERYEKDPAFHALVDQIHYTIEQGTFTPTEIREAAMLAQIMYEQRHIRPTVFSRDDVIKGEV